VKKTLADPATGALWASQDADEGYYAADAEARARRAAPYVDRTFLCDRAAQMIAALVAAAGDLGDRALLDDAHRYARALLTLRAADGGFVHARAPSLVPGQLADQAHAARALLTLAAASPDDADLFRSAAQQALAVARRTLQASDGSFYDRPPATDEGKALAARARPPVDNAIMARALLAANDRKSAAQILTSFQATALAFGLESAPYALALQAFVRKTP
jgi:uncharacterized protein YyaL (SSP411 family)